MNTLLLHARDAILLIGDAILLIGDVSILKKMLVQRKLGFYLYYPDTNSFSSKLVGLYASRLDTFEKEIDLYSFELIEIICLLNPQNDNYKVIKPFFLEKDSKLEEIEEELFYYKGLASDLQLQLDEEACSWGKDEMFDSENSISCSDIEGHGLCSCVIRMRQEGKTDEEIAAFLESSKCSLSQIGVLLHPDPGATHAAQRKLAQRLLGKA